MRREDWPQRLLDAVDAARTAPFAWGLTDCCLWTADVVLAMTGTDPAIGYRGRYQDEAGAYEMLRLMAAGSVESAATQALGDPLPNPLFAQRGDVVMIEQPGGPALGICVGKDVAVVGPSGLGYVSITRAERAWRV